MKLVDSENLTVKEGETRDLYQRSPYEFQYHELEIN